MLRHPTLDQLHALGLQGMAKAFADLADADEPKDLTHADWLALLLDREMSWRRDKRLTTRLRAAKLRQQASVEDVDYRAVRGLDRALFQKLSQGVDRQDAALRPVATNFRGNGTIERSGGDRPSGNGRRNKRGPRRASARNRRNRRSSDHRAAIGRRIRACP